MGIGNWELGAAHKGNFENTTYTAFVYLFHKDKESAMDKVEFDQEYYRKLYDSRVAKNYIAKTLPAKVRSTADAFSYFGIRLRNAIDVGCGFGLWRDELAKIDKNIRYLGTENSQYLCDRLGWRKMSIADCKVTRKYDLVICQGVLDYLDDAEAEYAIERLSELTRGILYLEVLTCRDWEQICRQDLTDNRCYMRSGEWYKNRISKFFLQCGRGAFLHRTAKAYYGELDVFS